MQSSVPTDKNLSSLYTAAVDALAEMGRTYLFLGRARDARRVLRSALPVLADGDAEPRHRLQLLLMYGQVLVVEHLITHEDAATLLAVVSEARDIAEQTQEKQHLADALSLLGNASYCTTLAARLQRGVSPDSPQDQSIYADALLYQQQALALRKELSDTRGISESSFHLGIVYERWRQTERALDYYRQACRLADQHGYLFEKTEPTRHLALHTMMQGDLDGALELAQQALQLREETGFRPYQPFDHLLLRMVYLARGDEEHARLHTQQATALANEMGYPDLVSSMPDIRQLLSEQPGEA